MLPKLKRNERRLKNLINLVFLILSSFLIVYFLINLTSNPYVKVGVGIFAIILEVFMQYLLSTGRIRWKNKQWIRACLLFFFYGLYVLAYAIPSATGFFMAEINAQEEITAKKTIVEDTDKQRLKQINSTINTLNAQLAAESKTGFGKRSQQIMEEVKQLTKEQTAIQKRFGSTPTTTATVNTDDLFQIMGDLFGVSGNLFKLFIFSVSVLMVYVGLVMTSWDLDSEEDNMVIKLHEKETETPKMLEVKDDETPVETPIETATIEGNGKKVCPTCGKHFPFKQDKRFCSSNCRLKAYRNQTKTAI